MITQQTRTVAPEDGVVVGDSTVTSVLRGSYQADGTVVTQEVVHTRSVFGDQTCSIQTVWRQADCETAVDHWSGGRA